MGRGLALLLLAGIAGFRAVQAALVLRQQGRRQASPIGAPQCEQLQEAILEANPTCQAAEFAEEWFGCTCEIPLPRNVDQLPNMALDPYALEALPGSVKFGLPPREAMPPPSNPALPYQPQPMEAECPFAAACGASGGFNCVGFDSFGFSSVHLAPYTPSTAYLKTMSCSYMMGKGGQFTIPAKVKSFHRMQEQRDKAQEAYRLKLNAVCPGLPAGTSLGDFCQALFSRQDMCQLTWATMTKTCQQAPPPIGFTASTQGFHLCPFECETPSHTGYGPEQYKSMLKGAS
mmetsp:Transcript_69748/g.179849  ORF Transcript_69748/g.179849 Transcript_69748/m.179849 type:complete len:288 (+) Transcript_69748:2-865(+)